LHFSFSDIIRWKPVLMNLVPLIDLLSFSSVTIWPRVKITNIGIICRQYIDIPVCLPLLLALIPVILGHSTAPKMDGEKARKANTSLSTRKCHRQYIIIKFDKPALPLLWWNVTSWQLILYCHRRSLWQQFLLFSFYVLC